MFRNRLEQDYDIVESGLSPILYHYTSVWNAASILKANKFVLPTFLGTGSDQPLSKGKMYYLSMTRQKAGGYHNDAQDGVVFELDGRKLSHKFGGTAFDYWGEEWRQSAKKGGGGLQQYLHLDENEDRLLTDKPEIKDASAYIKSVHLLFGFKDNPHVVENVRNVIKYCKQYKIPVHVYEDQKAFLLHDTRRAVPFEKLKQDLKVGEKEPAWSERFKTTNPFARYMKIYNARRKSDLSYKELGAINYSDSYQSLDSTIHNYKSKAATRKYLEELLALWKKLGVKTSKEFIAKLREKYDALP